MVVRYVTNKLIFYLLFLCLCIFMLISYTNVVQLQGIWGPADSVIGRSIQLGRNWTDSNLKHSNDKKNFTSNSKVPQMINAGLVVCVLSAPKNFGARNTIRETWAHVKYNGTKVLFVVGLGNVGNRTGDLLRKEHEIYKDIVFLKHFKESFDNLTQKTLQTMQLVNDNILFDYFMKVDDDSFLKLDLILKYLSNKAKQRFYWGYFLNKGRIFKKGKWAEPKKYICDHYVSYATGWGYVLSQDLVQHIAENSDKLVLFKNEDASVGTWLAPLDIHKIHDVRFKNYKQWKKRLSQNCTDNVILLNPVPLTVMKKLSNRIAVNGTLC